MHRGSPHRLIATISLLLGLATCALAVQSSQAQSPVGTAFAFQGRLTDTGRPATGSYDLEFRLFDSPAGATQIGSTIAVDDHAVANGLFTVRLDFGSTSFAGQARWLETSVRAGSSVGPYTPLSPRQELTATPCALYALKVADHSHWGGIWSGAGTGLSLSGGYTGLYASGSGFGVLAVSGPSWAVTGQSTTGGGVAGTSSSGYGVYGSTASPSIAAVYGNNTGSGPGVLGESASGPGVKGNAKSSTIAGVDGTNTSSGPGVHGMSGVGHGVYGSSAGSGGAGVFGENTGSGRAVEGVNNSSEPAVFGGNGGTGPGVEGSGGPSGDGVAGSAYSVSANAIMGEHFGGGNAVYGLTKSAAGYAAVHGSNTGTGSAVWGGCDDGIGVSGFSKSGTKAAVDGLNHGAGPGVSGQASGGDGVYGNSTGTGVHGDSFGGYGVRGENNSDTKAGVYGKNAGTGPALQAEAGIGYGVDGKNTSGTKAAVHGANTSTGAGVHGESSNGYGVNGYSGTSYGVYGRSFSSYAGYFEGNTHVNGTLTKSAGSFKIDHPLDPENQYLYHSFVESPDMMNVYNGNVTLDDRGEAWIEMPDWFEALNRDFRYQLTPIGGPGPNLHVAEEIAGNRFRISGGTPGLKVSWQVTGIRHDPYAEENRIPVEETKPEGERGTFWRPQATGQSPLHAPNAGLVYGGAQ